MTVSRCLVLLGLAVSLATGACGRKADLDTPSQAANDAKRNGVAVNQPAQPAPPPVEDRRFILDSLI